MKMPVIEKLLAAAGEARTVMAADKTGKGPLPVNGQPFKPFEKLPVQ